MSTLKQQLVSALLAGVERVLRYERLREELAAWVSGRQPGGRTFVLAIGKAALSMTEAAAQVLSDVSNALVVVPHGYPESWPRALPFADRVEVAEGAHPLPDASSIAAASAVERFLADLTADDEVVVLVSGGGSALVAAPADGLDDATWHEMTSKLYRSGESIARVNEIRKEINRLAGGGVARLAHPASVSTFVLSDVPGDDPCMVASGPTCVPSQEHPPIVVGSNADVVNEVAATLRAAGLDVHVVPGVDGEARETGTTLAELAASKRGTAVVFGGETTVTVNGDGKGGRCQELVVAAACALEDAGIAGVVACVGTDGRDGPTDAAGAAIVVSGATHWRVEGATALAKNDTYPLLEAAGALIRTGPTHTNVMDVGAIIALP